MYNGSKQKMQTILRCCNYLVLFGTRQNMATARTLSNQYFFGEKHKLMDPFSTIMNSSNREYLVIDFRSADSTKNVILGGLRSATDAAYYFTFNDDSHR